MGRLKARFGGDSRDEKLSIFAHESSEREIQIVQFTKCAHWAVIPAAFIGFFLLVPSPASHTDTGTRSAHEKIG